MIEERIYLLSTNTAVKFEHTVANLSDIEEMCDLEFIDIGFDNLDRLNSKELKHRTSGYFKRIPVYSKPCKEGISYELQGDESEQTGFVFVFREDFRHLDYCLSMISALKNGVLYDVSVCTDNYGDYEYDEFAWKDHTDGLGWFLSAKELIELNELIKD